MSQGNISLIRANAALLIIGELVTKVLYFVAFIVLTRTLGPEQFGVYSFALSFALLFSLLADFGLNTLVIREVSRTRTDTDQYLGTYGILKVGLALIGAILIPLAYVVRNEMVVPVSYIIFGALAMVTEQLIGVPRASLQARERMRHVAYSRMMEKLLSLISIGVLFLFHQMQVAPLLGVLVMVNIVTLFYTLYLSRGSSSFAWKFSIQAARHLARRVVPFALFFASSFFSVYISGVLLGYLDSTASVGVYQSAFQMVMAFAFVGGMIVSAFYPQLAVVEDASLLLKEKLRMLGVASTVLATAFFWGAPLIIRLLFGTKFMAAIGPFKILSLDFACLFFNYALISLFFARNKPWFNMVTAMLGALTNAALNYFFIARYGAVGAAASTAATEAMVLGLAILIGTRKLLFGQKHVLIIGQTLAALGVTIAVPYGMQHFFHLSEVLTAFTSGFVLVLSVWATRLLRVQDLKGFYAWYVEQRSKNIAI